MWIRFNTTNKYWEEAVDETDPASLFTQLDVSASALVSGNLAMARMPTGITQSGSSGNDRAISFTNTYNQSGTAGSADIYINRVENTLGSGNHYFIHFQVGGVDKFRIWNSGVVQMDYFIANSYARTPILKGSSSSTQVTLELYGGTSTGAVSGTADSVNVKIGMEPTVYNTATAGYHVNTKIFTRYNQASGTAANTELLIDRTETTIGSGAQFLIDAQVGGTSKFSVKNTGVLSIASGMAISAGTPSDAGIVIPSAVPTTTTNALYNDSGTLKFNGSSLIPSNVVVESGSYANPSWITSLAGTKITGIAPTKVGADCTVTYPTGAGTWTKAHDITIPGGTLATNGDQLIVTASMIMGNNANNKQWILRFNGDGSDYDCTPLGLVTYANIRNWFSFRVIRLTSTTGLAMGVGYAPYGAGIFLVSGTFSHTWTNDFHVESHIYDSGSTTHTYAEATIVDALLEE
jgi:hypothetical protein